MKDAIQKAIEGGFVETDFHRENDDYSTLMPSAVWSDPLFWQALGKAMGFNDTCYHLGQGAFRHTTQSCGDPHSMKRWQYEWHDFIDALAEGKSPDEFFTQLLNP